MWDEGPTKLGVIISLIGMVVVALMFWDVTTVPLRKVITTDGEVHMCNHIRERHDGSAYCILGDSTGVIHPQTILEIR